MARPKKKAEYDAEKIMKELLAAVADSYNETGELKLTAEEFGMSPLKVRKLLVTAGAYSNEVSEEVNSLYKKGKTVEEIRQITGLGKSSVNGYLPYTKAIYKPEELSLNAERINVFRGRQQAVQKLILEMNEVNLWEAVVAFQNYPFYTVSGLPYSYTLKKGRKGELTRELIINRRTGSKPIVWSSVVLAFNKALDMEGQIIGRPKELGDIRGISYIYPMLYRFGIIQIPEKTADKVQLKGGVKRGSSRSL